MSNSNLTIINIKQLAGILSESQLVKRGIEMNEITILENAFLTIKDGIIDDFGIMSSFDNSNYNDIFDAKQVYIMNTHISFSFCKEQKKSLLIK